MHSRVVLIWAGSVIEIAADYSGDDKCCDEDCGMLSYLDVLLLKEDHYSEHNDEDADTP
ncbi:MAG TPA: hypothetical protein VK555_03695 [Terriglobales bacterium]|jgi:hypothetical protein|nr:hypothetical protein [Terriglobales bacterium]